MIIAPSAVAVFLLFYYYFFFCCILCYTLSHFKRLSVVCTNNLEEGDWPGYFSGRKREKTYFIFCVSSFVRRERSTAKMRGDGWKMYLVGYEGFEGFMEYVSISRAVEITLRRIFCGNKETVGVAVLSKYSNNSRKLFSLLCTNDGRSIARCRVNFSSVLHQLIYNKSRRFDFSR